MDTAERATIDAEVIEVQTARAAKYNDIDTLIQRYSDAIGTVHQVNLQTAMGTIATNDKGLIAAADKTLQELIEGLKIEQADI